MKYIACGDIALCRKIDTMILDGKKDEIAKEVRDRLKNVDLFIADIECPLTDSNDSAFDYPTLKGSCASGQVLKELGVHVGTLANNHIADYGFRGFQDTVSVLEKHEIMWCGVGRNHREACRPLVFERDGIKIGILALAQPENSIAQNGKWGAGLLEPKSAIPAMQKLAKKVDVAIASLHFGVEFASYPTPDQIELCHNLVDSGALVVIGHHPHVAQGYEYYKDGVIAYSLGNFIFDMKPADNRFTRMGLLFEFEVDTEGKLKDVNFIPIDMQEGNPKHFVGNDLIRSHEYLVELCEPLANKQMLRKEYYFICRNNFEMLLTFVFHQLKKGNLNRVISAINVQFSRPQLLKLRIDLLRFLFNGNAYLFENKKNSHQRDLAGKMWYLICRVCLWAGKVLPKRLTRV